MTLTNNQTINPLVYDFIDALNSENDNFNKYYTCNEMGTSDK